MEIKKHDIVTWGRGIKEAIVLCILPKTSQAKLKITKNGFVGFIFAMPLCSLTKKGS